MNIIRTIIFGIILSASSSALAQSAQDMDYAARMALIDSLSNPMVVEGAEVMCFENERIDAGEMSEDSAPSEYEFMWTNKGQAPISVTWVQTTCGCAAPSYDRVLVQPGDSSSIKITYHPKGRPGGFTRKIMVYTNLSDKLPTAVLELSGKVIPSVMPTGDYPVAFGNLLLKRSLVEFSADTRQTERIECLNAGDKVLEISAETKTLPAGLLVEPLTIAPGEIADLVLRFNPAVAEKPLSEYYPVFLLGIPLPPTKCMITVNFK